MPTYSYFCSEQHETSWWGAYKSRPAEVPCSTCGAQATVGVARPIVLQPSEQDAGPTYHEYKGISLHDFLCSGCGEAFDEIVDPRLGETPSNGKPCPKCGAAAWWQPGARIDRFSERFPYYDRGLGCIVTSRQHRLDVAKSRGLTPVEGDWDVDKYLSKGDQEDDRLTKEYADYCDKLDNAPAFRNYRRARDQGRL